MPDNPSIDLACDACGKRYTLKAELAGKRVKCKCGHGMTVPAPQAAVDDLYDIVDDAPRTPAKKPPIPAIPTAQAVAGTARGGGVQPVARPSTGAVAYESKRTKKDRFDVDNLIEVKRDIYFPIALLIIGAIGLLAWAIVEAHASSAGIVLFSAMITIKTVLKTLILVGLAVVIAPAAGLSFGNFWYALLKFAAIVVFADMILMWTESWIDSLGGSGGRRSGAMVGMLKTMLLGAFIAIQLRFLFDMDSEETGMIAIPMAILNRILELVIWAFMLGFLEGLTSAATAPAAPPAAATTPAAPPAAAPGIGTAPLPATAPALSSQAPIDPGTRELLKGAIEGHEWVARFHSDKLHGVVYETIEHVQPKRLYFKTVGANAVAVIIELPDLAEARANVFVAANQMIRRYSRDKTELADTGQRYVTFEVPNNSKRP